MYVHIHGSYCALNLHMYASIIKKQTTSQCFTSVQVLLTQSDVSKLLTTGNKSLVLLCARLKMCVNSSMPSSQIYESMKQYCNCDSG